MLGGVCQSTRAILSLAHGLLMVDYEDKFERRRRIGLVGHEAPVHTDLLTLEHAAFLLTRVPDHF